VTTTAAWQKLFHPDPKIGFLSGAADLAAKYAAGALTPEKMAVAGKLIFNQRVCALLTGIFLCVLWIVIADMLRIAWRAWRGDAVHSHAEAPYERSRYAEVPNG
jgi:carbon starvation protein